jgi:type VI secretion system protein ImpA
MPLQTAELLLPIAGPSPGGSDIRYDPVFDQIKRARIEEADLPTGEWARERKTADYVLVVKLASDVLSKKSKDLQVAAWLCEALLKREGFAGFKSGLELLGSLLNDFWDTLHPALEEEDDLELRVAPLDWVGQYLVPAVRLVAINRSEHNVLMYRESRALGYETDADTYEKQEARREALGRGVLSAEQFDEAFQASPKAWYKQLIADVDGALKTLDALDRIAQDKFGREAPRFSPLREAIQDVRQVVAQLLARKLELEPDPPEAEPVAELMLEEPGKPGETATALPATPRTRADAEARIAAAARYLRGEDPAHPAPYLLLRGFRWGELRSRPGQVDPKLLAAPPTELRTRLRGMLLDARWQELLEAGEEVMATVYGRGWLDLQRYMLAACAGLGSDFDQVANSILGALSSLLRDVPQLPSLALMDDTPTANAETQAWLRDLNLASEESLTAAPAPRESVAHGTSAGRALLERALQRVRAGESEKAIELLVNPAVQERSARERFLRRSLAARIMVDTGREAVALPILEDLLKEIETHDLEAWEASEVVAQPLGLMYRALLRTQGESSETQSLYLRICRLDPLQAIQIVGKPVS